MVIMLPPVPWSIAFVEFDIMICTRVQDCSPLNSSVVVFFVWACYNFVLTVGFGGLAIYGAAGCSRNLRGGKAHFQACLSGTLFNYPSTYNFAALFDSHTLFYSHFYCKTHSVTLTR